jgi:elongation factor P
VPPINVECVAGKTPMVIASDLKQGMVVRIENQIYRVLEVESKVGAAKMGGLVRAKLSNLKSGRMWEHHLRPQERLEVVELERHMMEFLYSAGDSCTFMRPDTFEQLAVPVTTLGLAEKFLQPGMELPVEFFENEPIGVVLPDVAEARVASTAPPTHSQQDAAWKEATLENGLSIRVPLFVAPGEIVRVNLNTGRYLERVRAEHKRGA